MHAKKRKKVECLDAETLLGVCSKVKDGDFSVRLAAHWTGVNGKAACDPRRERARPSHRAGAPGSPHNADERGAGGRSREQVEMLIGALGQGERLRACCQQLEDSGGEGAAVEATVEALRATAAEGRDALRELLFA